jgi:hypothetical protein
LNFFDGQEVTDRIKNEVNLIMDGYKVNDLPQSGPA